MRVNGRWKYLYRAIDKGGAMFDFYLADRRNAKAAERFLAAASRRSRDWMPRVINTDKNPAYGEAIAELKQEGLLPKETQHRQVKYLNNRLEGDHGKLKRLIKPTLGFQSMKTAYATIKGFEVMRMFKNVFLIALVMYKAVLGLHYQRQQQKNNGQLAIRVRKVDLTKPVISCTILVHEYNISPYTN